MFQWQVQDSGQTRNSKIFTKDTPYLAHEVWSVFGNYFGEKLQRYVEVQLYMG